MGLLSAVLGNASEIDVSRLDTLLSSVLVPNERIEKAYQLVRDLFVLTNKRVILVDKQGVTGKKMELVSVPYGKITKFSMETAGTFDLDSELKIWVGSDPVPVSADFRKNTAIKEAYATLSRHALDA